MARKTSWTAEEYLAQREFYFSESTQAKVPVAEMAPQYALNAYRKLLREFGCAFSSTELAIALGGRVAPGMEDLRVMLDEHGRARITPADLSVSGARTRLRRAGATRTHVDGDWVIGERDADIQVRVKKVKH
jgi:hypothetical protein